MAKYLKIAGETYRLPDDSDFSEVNRILLEGLGRGTAATIRLAAQDENGLSQIIIGSTASHVVLFEVEEAGEQAILDTSG